MKKTISTRTAPQIYGPIVERLKATPRPESHQSSVHAEWSRPADTNILITSAERRDGRTTTAVGLALATAIAKPRQRILLADLDQRHSGLVRLLGRRRDRSTTGIVDVLHGRAELSEAVRATALENLHLLQCGSTPLNVPEDCQSDGLRRTLAEIASRYDYAFFDSPALNEHVEGRLLGELMDRVVLVVRSDRSRKEDVLAARRHLPESKLVGAIINDCRRTIPSFLSRHL